ncbi:MAG TPA: GNAT family N-acetyltransferase [Actinopolymorphaceae bacterium]
MRDVDCVGALVRDAHHRVFTQRRTPTRRILPGVWDIVGGHLDPGETPEQALAREIEEETGWRLRRIEAVLADWEWEYDGRVRRELDYLVEVDGDLDAPVLAPREHDAYAWIGPDDLDLLMENRDDDDRALRDLVAKAVRTRLTARLRLEPIGPEHAEDLRRVLDDRTIAEHDPRSDAGEIRRHALRVRTGWESDRVHEWIAYDRSSGEPVGRGGLSYRDLDGERRLRLGWAIPAGSPDGYAVEIGRAGLAYAFEDLAAEEVVALVASGDRRSPGVTERTVVERLGMEYDRDVVLDGESCSCYRSRQSTRNSAKPS